jgi:hypothetical protein
LLAASLLIAAVGMLIPAPAHAQRISLNLQELVQDYDNYQQQDREKFVGICRDYAEAAEEAISTSTTRCNTLTQQVASARETFEAARNQESQARKATQAARRAQQDREEALLAAQSAESEYGRAVTGLNEARDDQDEIVRRTVGLPARAKPANDQQRNLERARLSATQKSRIRESKECKEADERVAAASREVARIKAALLESDADYRAAVEQVTAAVEAEEQAEAAAKSANVELTRSRKELKSANAELGAAKKVLAQANTYLAQMGVPREKK